MLACGRLIALSIALYGGVARVLAFSTGSVSFECNFIFQTGKQPTLCVQKTKGTYLQ